MSYPQLFSVDRTIIPRLQQWKHLGAFHHQAPEPHVPNVLRAGLALRTFLRHHIVEHILDTVFCKEDAILLLERSHMVQYCFLQGKKQVVYAHNRRRSVHYSLQFDGLGLSENLTVQVDGLRGIQRTLSPFASTYCF